MLNSSLHAYYNLYVMLCTIGTQCHIRTLSLLTAVGTIPFMDVQCASVWSTLLTTCSEKQVCCYSCNIVYYDRHPSCHRHDVVLLSILSYSVETKIRSAASSFLILSTELYLLIIFHPMKFGTDGAVLCCLVQLSILTNYHTRLM